MAGVALAISRVVRVIARKIRKYSGPSHYLRRSAVTVDCTIFVPTTRNCGVENNSTGGSKVVGHCVPGTAESRARISASLKTFHRVWARKVASHAAVRTAVLGEKLPPNWQRTRLFVYLCNVGSIQTARANALLRSAEVRISSNSTSATSISKS